MVMSGSDPISSLDAIELRSITIGSLFVREFFRCSDFRDWNCTELCVSDLNVDMKTSSRAGLVRTELRRGSSYRRHVPTHVDSFLVAWIRQLKIKRLMEEKNKYYD